MNMKYAFLDTETSGIFVSSIIPEMTQLSVISNDDDTYYNEYFKISKKLTSKIISKTGITDDLLRIKGKKLELEIPNIERFINQFDTIIAHNANFDKKILEISGIKLKPNIRWIDTMELVKTVFGKRRSLSYVYQYYFKSKIKDAHNAAGDTLALKEIWNYKNDNRIDFPEKSLLEEYNEILMKNVKRDVKITENMNFIFPLIMTEYSFEESIVKVNDIKKLSEIKVVNEEGKEEIQHKKLIIADIGNIYAFLNRGEKDYSNIIPACRLFVLQSKGTIDENNTNLTTDQKKKLKAGEIICNGELERYRKLKEVIVVAKNFEGYKQLVKMIECYWKHSSYEDQYIFDYEFMDLLSESKDNLIVIKDNIPHNNVFEEKDIGKYATLYGPDDANLPLQFVSQQELEEFSKLECDYRKKLTTKFPKVDFIDIEKIAKDRLKELKLDSDEVYTKRLDYEIEVIKRQNYFDYFIMVYDLLKYCKEHNIFYGPGRGSCVGSLFCYLIGITKINPMKYDLLFERFLDPAKASEPDIDLDIEPALIPQCMKYLEEKYGFIAHIGTIGSSGIKSLNELEKQGIITKENSDYYQVKEILQEGEECPDSFKYKNLLVNVFDKQGTHPCGYAIVNERLPIPVIESTNTMMMNMKGAEALHILKLDMLSLDTMTIFKKTLKKIGKDLEWLDNIPLDDKGVYKMLEDGDYPGGVFQLDGETMRKVVKTIKPQSMEDLAAINAIGRPASMQAGGLEKYKEAKKWKSEKANKILEKTRYQVLYQEQSMQLMSELAEHPELSVKIRKLTSKASRIDEFDGMPIAQAVDFYRRKFIGLGENEEDYIQTIKQTLGDTTESNIRTFAKQRNIDESRLMEMAGRDDIWTAMLGGGSYSFNKSHSVAYSLISYQCVYLMKYYPEEYLLSVMDTTSNENNILNIILFLKKQGYQFKFDRYKSQLEMTFDRENKIIYWGYKHIQGLGEKGVSKFIDKINFLKEHPEINKERLEALKQHIKDMPSKKNELLEQLKAEIDLPSSLRKTKEKQISTKCSECLKRWREERDTIDKALLTEAEERMLEGKTKYWFLEDEKIQSSKSIMNIDTKNKEGEVIYAFVWDKSSTGNDRIKYYLATKDKFFNLYSNFNDIPKGEIIPLKLTSYITKNGERTFKRVKDMKNK